MPLQEGKVLVAMDLGKKSWHLVFGDGSRERHCVVTAGSQAAVNEAVARAKEKFGLPADAPVVFCYEAGRNGFWIYRWLKREGYECYVMNPSSIEVARGARQRKTDRLDAERLRKLLIRRELHGEQKAFAVVRVPSAEQESELRVHRERERLVKERSAHRARMNSLCVLHGIELVNPEKTRLPLVRDWDGKPLPGELYAELEREQQRLLLVVEQLTALEKQQEAALETESTEALRQARKWQQLKGVGRQSGWVLAHECFAWRRFGNRKHLGSFAGLTGTPFDSGETLREQGISKAGSPRVRTTMIELAWGWVRWQPSSALSKWFVETYVAGGGRRSRRKGIVAVARKWLIALWKFLEQDIVPEGALLKT